MNRTGITQATTEDKYAFAIRLGAEQELRDLSDEVGWVFLSALEAWAEGFRFHHIHHGLPVRGSPVCGARGSSRRVRGVQGAREAFHDVQRGESRHPEDR